MLTELFPNLLNFESVNLYSLIEVAVMIILAIGAITVGVHASRLNDQTVESNLKTAEIMQNAALQNTAIQQAEIRMAVSKQILEIYNFFIRDIFITNFFKDSANLLQERCNELLYQSCFIFNAETHAVIEKSIRKILDAYSNGIPAYTQEEYDRARNTEAAGIEIKIYEAFMNRENNAEDTIKKYESMLKRTVFLCNIREDVAKTLECFKFNLGCGQIYSA